MSKIDPLKSNVPLPPPGETVRMQLPDSFDGIRFEIGRIFKYIQDARKNPVIIATAQKIAELASDTARQLKRKVTSDSREEIWLEGIHAWCHARFEHVSSPDGIELIKTPGRMLRELEIPEILAKAMWEPIRDRMAKADGKDPASLTLPMPKTSGSSAVAVTLPLSLAAAIGITPIKMKFGGYDGTLCYVWGFVWASEKWYDVDIILPEFGKHRKFGHYEEIEVPI